MDKAEQIVSKMIENDAFSQWLGIEVINVSEGTCKLKMTIRDEMTNGFKIAHGGISYALADSALAFAANSYGLQSLSIKTSICNTKKVNIGDLLIANKEEIMKNEKKAIYKIEIKNQHNVTVANSEGTVHRTKKKWLN